MDHGHVKSSGLTFISSVQTIEVFIKHQWPNFQGSKRNFLWFSRCVNLGQRRTLDWHLFLKVLLSKKVKCRLMEYKSPKRCSSSWRKSWETFGKIENEGKIVLLFLVVYLTLHCVAKSLWSCFCKVFAPFRSCLFTLIQTAFLLQYMRHRAFLIYNFQVISKASEGC